MNTVRLVPRYITFLYIPTNSNNDNSKRTRSSNTIPPLNLFIASEI